MLSLNLLSALPSTATASIFRNYSKIQRTLSDPLSALQVPLPPVDEKKKVIEDVDKDRRYAIDAAIVRTMKSRKMLAHNQVCHTVIYTSFRSKAVFAVGARRSRSHLFKAVISMDSCPSSLDIGFHFQAETFCTSSRRKCIFIPAYDAVCIQHLVLSL